MPSPTDSFELQAKADEWMDVTPKEELLRAELERLKEAFEKCSSQLESSRLENDLLKDREVHLEKESDELRLMLNKTSTALEKTQTELTASKASSENRIGDLEHRLDDCSTQLKEAEAKYHGIQSDFSKASEEHVAAIERLNRDLRSTRAQTKTHRDAAVRFAEDLRLAHEQHKKTKDDLEGTIQKLQQEQQLHAKAIETTRIIAVHAETLKAEKVALEKTIAIMRNEKEANAAIAKKTTLELETLRAQLVESEKIQNKRSQNLESELADRVEDLNRMGKSFELLQMEQKDSEIKLRDLALENTSVKAHLNAMEEGRHELLNRQSELEEMLEEHEEDLERAHQEIHSTKTELDETNRELDILRERKASEVTKAELEQRLEEQKSLYENRLTEIHSILGLTFTKAIKSEVREIHRSTVKQIIPMAARVPLLKDHAYHEGTSQRVYKRHGIKTA